ncbi:hypothetical protein V6N13_147881 [Hibiscus sabdariffa]
MCYRIYSAYSVCNHGGPGSFSCSGAIASGRTADMVGRKGTMWFLNLFYIVGWLAIAFAKVPVYLAEITPKNLRVGPFISWRILALIGIIPGLVQLPLLFFIPESPRWLVKVGRETEFETALRSLRGKRANVFEEANSIKIGIGIMVLQHSGGVYGYTYYSGVIFVSAGLSEYVGLCTLAAVEVSSGGICLGSFLTGTSFLLQDHDMWSKRTPILALISIWVYMGSYQVGMAVIPWIIVAEIFPINIKGAAGSMASLIANICNWIVTYNFNFLFQWSSAGTFFMFSAICGLSVVFIAKLVPETKGRTLEEIHASLTSSSPW